MRIQRLEVSHFRNIEQAVWVPAEHINIVYGENAQGKTNLMEALWLFTGGRSFRRVKDAELVRFGQQEARLTADFFGEGREQTAALRIDRRRHAALNGIDQPSAARLTGHFTAVIFSPDHLSLVKDGPEGRRRFLDAAICQLRPAYVRILTEYNRLLQQRNALLKQSRFADTAELLKVFTDRLAAAGSEVLRYRMTYIDRLRPLAGQMYDGLSSGREKLTVAYESEQSYTGRSREELTKLLLQRLEESLPADREAGFTTVGPHREDVELCVNNLAARTFGSQGQQRSVVLSLKMAEASLIREITGEYPVVLLDDVMSELDAARQDYLVSHLHGWQVLITCCDPSAVRRMTNGRVFRMQSGCLTEEG